MQNVFEKSKNNAENEIGHTRSLVFESENYAINQFNNVFYRVRKTDKLFVNEMETKLNKFNKFLKLLLNILKLLLIYRLI